MNQSLAIFKRFFLLGLTTFGGPFAAIGLFQKIFVQDLKWIPTKAFNEALTLVKALPGPTSTQLAIYLGYYRYERWGGFLAGLGFLLPSFFLILGFAFFYNQFKTAPGSSSFLIGIQSAALSLILFSFWQFLKQQFKSVWFWFFAFLSAPFCFYFPTMEPLCILSTGMLSVFLVLRTTQRSFSVSFDLFVIALKAAAFTFGTGLSILPILYHACVEQNHWLSHQEFMDAMAFGQLTPGPFVITMTFVGYRVQGLSGALLATIGIFLPGFFNMLTWFPQALHHFQSFRYAAAFLQGALASIISALFIALIKLGDAQRSVFQWYDWGIVMALFLILCSPRFSQKIPTWLLIPFSGFLRMLKDGI